MEEIDIVAADAQSFLVVITIAGKDYQLVDRVAAGNSLKGIVIYSFPLQRCIVSTNRYIGVQLNTILYTESQP